MESQAFATDANLSSDSNSNGIQQPGMANLLFYSFFKKEDF
jgi:hypothetical protein